jgi:hypothetical protein
MKVSLHTRRIYFIVIALLLGVLLIHLITVSTSSDKIEQKRAEIYNEKVQFKENNFDGEIIEEVSNF